MRSKETYYSEPTKCTALTVGAICDGFKQKKLERKKTNKINEAVMGKPVVAVWVLLTTLVLNESW